MGVQILCECRWSAVVTVVECLHPANRHFNQRIFSDRTHCSHGGGVCRIGGRGKTESISPRNGTSRKRLDQRPAGSHPSWYNHWTGTLRNLSVLELMIVAGRPGGAVLWL